jgi:hypothetical protein
MNRIAATLVGVAVSLALQGCATQPATQAEPAAAPVASTSAMPDQKQRLDVLEGKIARWAAARR